MLTNNKIAAIKKKDLFQMMDQDNQRKKQSNAFQFKANQKRKSIGSQHKKFNYIPNEKIQKIDCKQKIDSKQKIYCQHDKEQNSFSIFNLNIKIKKSLQNLGYMHPTKIQQESLKYSLQDCDLLCLSETGSGKTLSFVLPIINYICNKFVDTKSDDGLALILAPTRQLCIQIKQYFDRFFSDGLQKVTSVVLYGGVDPMKQVIELSKKPAVIISTPGRLLDHLNNTKGFNVNKLKYFVMDQADKLLNKDFQQQFNQILQKIPKQRNTYLYSATLTHKIDKLQKVSLKNPRRIQVSQRYQTVQNLEQFYIFVPSKMKDCYLLHLLNKNQGKKVIIFMQTKLGAQRVSLLLKQLRFKVECLHGDMSQIQRIIGLQKFKKDQVNIMVSTEVAARGLDINMVQVVINYDLCDPKSYIHRVGRTARIGRKGIAITIVTQYDVQNFQKIQEKLGQKMKEYQTNQKQAQLFLQKLQICHQQVTKKMKRKLKPKYN